MLITIEEARRPHAPPSDATHAFKGRYDYVVANTGAGSGFSQPRREFVIYNGKRAFPDLAIYFSL